MNSWWRLRCRVVFTYSHQHNRPTDFLINDQKRRVVAPRSLAIWYQFKTTLSMLSFSQNRRVAVPPQHAVSIRFLTTWGYVLILSLSLSLSRSLFLALSFSLSISIYIGMYTNRYIIILTNWTRQLNIGSLVDVFVHHRPMTTTTIRQGEDSYMNLWNCYILKWD